MYTLSSPFRPMSYSDSISPPKITKTIDWTIQATEWHDTTIGDLIFRTDITNVSRIKKHEAAFFIKSNYPDVNNNTVCKVGACGTGMIIRIGKYEYRVRQQTIHRKLIGEVL